MKTKNNLCERCGKKQEGDLTFFIGASDKPDWCVCQGTGRFVCPECYEAEQEDCRKIREEATRPIKDKLVSLKERQINFEW